MKHLSFAGLAVLAGLYGCATTESQTSATEVSSPNVIGSSTAGVAPGTARAPVGVGKGAGSSTTAGTGSQRPDLKRSVYYEFDKYEVKPEFRTLVETHARWLKANPQARLTVEGNADEQGSREYNLALGQRRAESVTKIMVLLGAKPEQIEAVSYGEEKPRSGGHGEKAWSENRRSDFAQR